MYQEQNLLQALSKSFQNYLEYGPRSVKKLAPIHGFFGETLQGIFGLDYKAHYLSDNSKELTLTGKYYPKDIDVTVTREGKPVFCLGLKFVTSNYKQNANNYFESMMGETANIQRLNIPYAQVVIFRRETPYYERDLKDQKSKKASKIEVIGQKDLSKYVNLIFDAPQAHRPFAIGILIIDIDEQTCQATKVPARSFLEKEFAEVLETKASMENLFREIETFAKFHRTQR